MPVIEPPDFHYCPTLLGSGYFPVLFRVAAIAAIAPDATTACLSRQQPVVKCHAVKRESRRKDRALKFP
ncbi:MAG TPA: hypothetical protein VMK32_12455 [Burkholderiaceae bacterium]|nr:hypothetical protein [Burkholderiaceae bacterium]